MDDFGGTSIAQIRDTYFRDGVVFLRSALEEVETRRVCEGEAELNELFASRGDQVRRGRFVDEWPASLDNVQRWQTIVALVNKLIGPDVALYYRRLLIKDKFFTGAISVHQELPFFNGGVEKIHIFLPISRNVEKNGHLRFYAGSHKYGLVGQGDIKPERFYGVRDVGEDLYPGDLVIMHHFTWHYSAKAQSDEPRYLLQLMYQPSDDGSYAGDTPELISGRWRTDLRFPASNSVLYYNLWSRATRRK